MSLWLRVKSRDFKSMQIEITRKRFLGQYHYNSLISVSAQKLSDLRTTETVYGETLLVTVKFISVLDTHTDTNLPYMYLALNTVKRKSIGSHNQPVYLVVSRDNLLSW